MKSLKTTIGILVGVALLFPVVVPAQTVTASSGASVGVQQLIALYSQLIQLLEQEIAQLQSQLNPLIGSSSQAPLPTTENPNDQSFSASPSSGSAPLAVTFAASGYDAPQNGSDYVVDFGDNNREQMVTGATAGTYSATHSYTAGGTFNAVMYLEQNLCGGVDSYGCVSDLQVGGALITVSGAPTQTITNTTTNPAPATGGSCVAYNRTSAIGSTTIYPSGTSLWSICRPDYTGPCPLAMGVNYMCKNGQWVPTGT